MTFVAISPPFFPTLDMDFTDFNQELALVAYRGFHENFISGMMDLQLMMESFSSSINNVNIQLMEEDLISTENQVRF